MRIATLLTCALLISGCQQRVQTADSAALPTGVTTIASTRQIMFGLTIPTSNVIFAAAGEAPSDETSWQNIEQAAALLTESGNLLLLGERAVDADNWRIYAVELIDSAAAAAAAARTRDAEALVELSDRIYASCENCHQYYMSHEPR